MQYAEGTILKVGETRSINSRFKQYVQEAEEELLADGDNLRGKIDIHFGEIDSEWGTRSARQVFENKVRQELIAENGLTGPNVMPWDEAPGQW